MEQVMITSINKQELIDIIENSLSKMLKNSKPDIAISKLEKPIGVHEVVAILRLSKASIYRLCGNLEIPHFKRGNRLYFYESKILNWVNNGRKLTKVEIDQLAENYK